MHSSLSYQILLNEHSQACDAPHTLLVCTVWHECTGSKATGVTAATLNSFQWVTVHVCNTSSKRHRKLDTACMHWLMHVLLLLLLLLRRISARMKATA
jgi:hypothetical protein